MAEIRIVRFLSIWFPCFWQYKLNLSLLYTVFTKWQKGTN